jgi:hypothetical protein
MKNRDRWIPRSETAKHHVISQKFPAARPIFWGPNQFTVYPSQYNEPSGWKPNELLVLPRVARFFFGSAPRININRSVYLGWINYANIRIRMADIPFEQMPIRQYCYYSHFTQVTEIRTAYGANLNTLDVLNANMLTVETAKSSDFTSDFPDFTQPFFSPLHISGQRDSFLNTLEDPPRTYSIVNFVGGDLGFVLPPPSFVVDIDSAGYPYDASTVVPSSPENYWTQSSLTPLSYPQFIRNRLKWTLHVYLINRINSSGQSNMLGIVRDKTGWDQLPTVTDPSVTALPFRFTKFVTGLVLP